MTKEEFTSIIELHAENADIFSGRYKRVGETNVYTYHRPAIDCVEPYIIINSNHVEHHSPDFFTEGSITRYLFEEFVELFINF